MCAYIVNVFVSLNPAIYRYVRFHINLPWLSVPSVLYFFLILYSECSSQHYSVSPRDSKYEWRTLSTHTLDSTKIIWWKYKPDRYRRIMCHNGRFEALQISLAKSGVWVPVQCCVYTIILPKWRKYVAIQMS